MTRSITPRSVLGRASGVFNGRSKKAGLPPGTMVHTREPLANYTRITLISYSKTAFSEREASVEDAFVDTKDSVRWVDVHGLNDIETIKRLGESFGAHPLVMEDVLHTNQRPKIEDYGSYLYVVARMLRTDTDGGSEQVSFLVGKDTVLSFQEIDGDVFEAVRSRLRKGGGKIQSERSDYLLYALLDSIVDHYFIVLERIAERIEELESALLADPRPAVLEKVYALKRELIFLRKAVWPIREVVASLERGDHPIVRKGTKLYLRDLYDHTLHVVEGIETFRDMVSGMLDLYLSSVSHRMNEVMKVLTIIATIFIPLTFIAGVYGMNFAFMPELDWPWAYPAVLTLMTIIGVGLLFAFKRKGWI